MAIEPGQHTWLINTGRRVVILNGRFLSTTKKLWLFGTLQDGATYAVDSETMFLLLSELLGPCDQSHVVVDRLSPRSKPVPTAGLFMLTMTIIKLFVRIMVLMTVPLFRMIFAGRSKR